MTYGDNYTISNFEFEAQDYRNYSSLANRTKTDLTCV